jgi:phospholipid/cholesterol/gamma-HCH transport system ATP-binding protein
MSPLASGIKPWLVQQGSRVKSRKTLLPSAQLMTSSPDNLVEITDVKFNYGEREILKGLNLRIPRGKVVAILGASGCGKSTLLRLIGGQEKPAQGSVKVAGRLVHELDTDSLYHLRRSMGMMFQAGGLFTDLSVYENIAFPLRENSDLPEELIRSLILMKLQVVGLRGARNLMPSELSGGMARRVALARAIVHDPMLAMYDEPFAGLDPISLNVIADLIRRLNDALGTTSIIVTYDVSESLKLVDYLYVIADGVVVGEGTPDEMLGSDNPVVRQFIHAEADGPIAFNYPAQPIAVQLGLK